MKKLLMIMLVLLLSINITGCGRSLGFTEEEFMEAGVLRMAQGDLSRISTFQVTYDDNKNITDARYITKYANYDDYLNNYLHNYKLTISKEEWLNSEEYQIYLENYYEEFEEDEEWEAGEFYTEVTKDDENLTITSVCLIAPYTTDLFEKDDNAYITLEEFLENPNVKEITYEQIKN